MERKENVAKSLTNTARDLLIENLINENCYHSLFFLHDGKYKHHGDYDTKDDAADEKEYLKNQGEKSVVIRVPKKEAPKDWTEIDIHKFVSDRLSKKKTK